MLEKILKLLAVLLVAYLAVSAVRIYFWNKEMTQEIYRQYDELVAGRRNCVLVPAKKIIRNYEMQSLARSPHDKLDNIRDLDAIGLLWRYNIGSTRLKYTAPFYIAIVVDNKYPDSQLNEIYNWSFKNKKFEDARSDRWLFGLPQNTDEDACTSLENE